MVSLSAAAAPKAKELLAEKGRLLLSDDFARPPVERKAHDFAEGWQRRLSYGDWTPLKEGGVWAANVPESTGMGRY